MDWCSFDFGLDPNHLIFTGVHYVVLDSRLPVVGVTLFHVDRDSAFHCLDKMLGGSPVHDDIVQRMPVPPGFRSGRKSPLGDRHSIVVLDRETRCLCAIHENSSVASMGKSIMRGMPSLCAIPGLPV